uniref:Uncharacterized protein n=1 Tax=Anopheles farauti TaxID=69004 RepID=A0A182QXS4_9DIPT
MARQRIVTVIVVEVAIVEVREIFHQHRLDQLRIGHKSDWVDEEEYATEWATGSFELFVAILEDLRHVMLFANTGKVSLRERWLHVGYAPLFPVGEPLPDPIHCHQQHRNDQVNPHVVRGLNVSEILFADWGSHFLITLFLRPQRDSMKCDE